MTLAMIVGLGLVITLLAAAGALHALSRLGSFGRAVGEACSRAPVLDVVVFAFVHGPWIAAWVVWWAATARTVGGFFGFFAVALVAQAVTLLAWSWLHEAAHPAAKRGPRIVHTLNRAVGRVRNHAAVWVTALAVPVFTIVRVAEVVVYPPLTWLVRLPRYRSADWVNVSRQKFDGLVGYDLIWCLYCDWMTGVWSLGSEMLRNVESFWCPIRFASPEKCENCRVDFPDVAGEWVAEGGMGAVANLLERKYPGPGGVNAWFGHPVRLTVGGKDTNVSA